MAGESSEAGDVVHSLADEGEPLSWPLVERRRDLPLGFTSPAHERREVDRSTPTVYSTDIDVAPLLPFRGAALLGAILRGLNLFSWSNWTLSITMTIVAAYTIFATLRPAKYRNDNRARLRIVAELAIVTGFVLVTGGWGSPLALCLVPTCMLAGFVGGTLLSAQLGLAAAAIISVQYLNVVGVRQGLRDTALWIGLLLLVAVTSGLSHRATMEAARHRQAALDRVGRLAEANALLFALQRVAQTLPASLDLQDVLNSTVVRVQSLIDHSMLTILLRSDVTGRLDSARTVGYVPDATWVVRSLPDGISEALRAPKTVRHDDLGAIDRRTAATGVCPQARSGLYAALRARGAIIGVIAIESHEPAHFGNQQAEILHGLTEPFGIAIDNARLFERLRIASADEERNRIARDLHDQIGSSLAFLGFEIDRSIGAAQRGDSVEHALTDLRREVTTMISDVRETLFDLRSNVSETQDLAFTLRQFVGRVQARSGMQVVLSTDQGARLHLAQERELWHIAREATINAERHSKARNLNIDWASSRSLATLTISDDGVGLTTEQARPDSYGLIGMRERAVSIGALLTTDTSPGGTTVRVVLRQPEGASQWD